MSLSAPPASMFASASPVSVSVPDPPVTFSMLRIVSSTTPFTVTLLFVAPFSVTDTDTFFSL